MAFATEAGGSGDIEILINAALAATNDDCSGATPVVDGDIGGNECSTDGFTWYAYTVVDDLAELDITVAATGGTPEDNPIIQSVLLNDCAGSDVGVNPTCLSAGDVLYIEAGDDTDPQSGDWEFGFAETLSTVANDACADITPEATPTCETTELTATDNTTEMACPETVDFGACAVFDMFPTVWYGFTTDANALTVDIDLTAGTLSGGQFVLINGDTGCPLDDGNTVSGCVTTLDDFAIDPSTTYYIAVAGTIAPGTFTLEVTPENIPANSDCATPAIYNVGDGATAGTNSCATPDPNGYCLLSTLDGQSHTVYYEYTVDAATTTNRDVVITMSLSTGAPAASIALGLFTDCAGTAVTNSIIGDPCDPTAGTGTVTLECVEPNTVLTIAVGSTDGDEGEFTIDITEINPAPANDVCDMATPIGANPLPSCQWEPISVDNTNTCPEAFTGTGGCNFHTDATAWYSVTLPANATGLEFQNFSEPGAYIGVFFDCAGAQEGNCASMDGDLVDGLTGGTTYNIAVSQPTPSEGPFDFEIKAIVPPANDDCDMAEVISDGDNLNGTTNCATPDFTIPNCSLDNTSHAVWYTYENTTGGNVDLTISVNAGGGSTMQDAMEISVITFSECAGTLLTNPGEDSEFCNTLGSDIFIECIENGETVLFMVASPDNSEGDFTIALTEDTTQPADDNDECINPHDETANLTTCEFVTIMGSTENACPEDFGFVGCDFSMNSTVWYQLDAPATGDNMTLEIENLTGVDNPFLAVFSDIADCDAPVILNAAMGNSCISDGSLSVFDVTAGMSYFIAVADGMEGDHSFDVKFVVPPVNDVCDPDAIALMDGVAEVGTNSCATEDLIGYCALGTDDESHVVYYSYEYMGTKNGILTIDVVAGGGSGTPATAISLGVWTDCNQGMIYTDENMPTQGDPCDILPLGLRFECVEPGTELIIAVGSADMSEGDFTITVDEDDSMTPDNDACADAELITITTDCEFQPVTGNNTNACPEEFTGSSCDFETNFIVWYEVEVPPNGVGLEFDDMSAGLFIGIFNNDCDNLAITGTVGQAGPVDCIDDDGQILNLAPGTYLIGVGYEAMNEDDFNFNIKTITPPVNDLCADAIEITTSGDANATESGTTACATFDFEIDGCADEDESSVYYTYTVPAGTNGITVTLTNTGTGQDFAVGLYQECGALPALFDDNVPTDCDLTDTEELVLSCLAEGDVIIIMVSTETDEGGTFDLTIDPTVPDLNCTANDLCENADDTSDIANPVTDDDQICWTDCNIDACPDNLMEGACDYSDLPTVFFSVTTDGDAIDATMSVLVNGGAGAVDMSPIFTVYDACGGAPMTDGECVEADANEVASQTGIEILPNTTYIIAVADANLADGLVGGDFDICVTISTTCNDDPCDPYELDETAPNTFTALECNTTIGSTPDEVYDVDPCPPGFTENSVYFTYTAGENVTLTTITVSETGGTTDAVDISAIVFEYDPANCMGDLSASIIQEECSKLGQVRDLLIPCPIPGNQYLIQIATPDGADGDFSLDVIETVQTSVCAVNDICDNATELPIDATCEDLTFDACNEESCPELFEFDACLFNDSPVVWFSFTTPADITGGSFSIDGTLPNPSMGLFEDDGCPQEPTPVNGDVDCVTNPAEIDFVELMPNTAYIMAVGSATGEEGDFTITYNLIAPPPNDSPCNTNDNPPEDITSSMGAVGSTCCALGFNDDPDEDIQNFAPCTDVTSGAAVWYYFEPEADVDGYQVNVNGATISGDMSVQIYAGTDAGSGCNGFANTDVIGSSCSSTSAEIRFSNCDPDAVYFIKVTTDDEDCGEFDISIGPATGCEFADECPDATTPLVTDTPVDCEAGENILSIDGCLDLACPADPDPSGACGHDLGPTVWFQINIDSDDANGLLTQVEAPGFDAVWSIFQGTSCDDMMPAGEAVQPGDPAVPCSFSDGDDDLHNVPIAQDGAGDPLTYWVAVTAIGEITDPNFTLNYASSLGCVSCSGTSSTDCSNGEFIYFDEEGNESEGPFCAGSEVTVCLNFTYDATATGNDWMHGIIPNFGNGWDIPESNLDAANIGTGWQWVPDDGPCAPSLNGYSLPNVCTYTEDGRLKMCNTACNFDCPCETGPALPDGSPVPSGWFTNSPGTSPTCNADCSPASFYGVVGGVNVTVAVCIPLKVKTFETPEECAENNDLSIDIQTTSDAITGCWNDPSPCIIDPSFSGPNRFIECDAPPIPNDNDPIICSGDLSNLELDVEGAYPIVITFEDNPNIEGEGSDSQWSGDMIDFTGGFGIINDQLINESGVVDSVIYIAIVQSDDFVCPATPIRIAVVVYPEIEIEFDPDPDFVCSGECTDISPLVTGGTGNYTDYNWSTNESGVNTIEVCPINVFEQQYSVTVTDDFGCTGEGTVTVIVKEPLEFEVDDITVCQDGEFNPGAPQYEVEVFDIISGDTPVNWTFAPGPGLEGFDGNGVFIINEEASFDPTGEGLELCITGETATSPGSNLTCTAEVCIKVFIFSRPTIEIVPDPLDCGSTDYSFTVNAEYELGGEVPNLIIRTCDGLVLFDEIQSTTGVFFSPIIDLNDFSCFEIVAYDDNGCEVTEEHNVSPTFGVDIEVMDVAVCEGEQAIPTVTNGSVYSTIDWTVAGDPSMTVVNTGATYPFVPDSTTTLFITATEANGCEATETVVVTLNDAPMFTLAEEFTFCSGGTATAQVSGGGTYAWTSETTNTVVSTADTLTTGMAGTYFVAVTDDNGCIALDTTTFVQETVITINITGADLCDGAETVLSYAGTFNNVVWNDGTSDIATDIDSVIVNTGGTFTVTATDPAGCPASGTITIDEFQTPVLVLPDVLDVCRDDSGVDSIFINFASLVTGVSGSWQQLQAIPATFVPPFDNVSFENIPSGQYQFVYMTNTATFPCVDAVDTVTINVRSCPCPSVDVRDPGPICNDGGMVDLNGAGVKITGEDGTWTVQSGPAGQNTGNLIDGATFTATDTVMPGMYGVLFTLDDQGGPNCQPDSLIMVTVIDAPVAEWNMAPARICNQTGGSDPTTIDLNTLLTAETTAGGEWTDDGGAVVANPNIDGTTITGPFPVTLTYTYTVTPAAGSPCGPVSTTVEFVVRDCNCPFFDVEPTLSLCNDEDPFDLTTVLDNPENLAGTWSSLPTGPVSGSMFDPSDLPSGGFTVVFTLDDDPQPGSNCPLTDTIIVSVINQPELALDEGTPPCNEDTGNGPTTVNLYDWIDDGGTNGTWIQTAGDPLTLDDQGGENVVVDFMGQDIGESFEFTYQTSSVQDPPCSNIDITVQIVVANCLCPLITIMEPADVCNDGGELNLNSLIGNSDPGTFEVRLLTTSAVITNDSILDYTGLTAGDWIITYTLDEIVSGSCIQDTTATLTVSDFAQLTVNTAAFEVCNNTNNGNNVIVDFTPFLTPNTDLTVVDMDGTGVDLTNLLNVNFDGVAPGDYNFEFTLTNDAPCPPSTGVVTITVDPCDCPLIMLGEPIRCLTAGNEMIDLTEFDDDNTPGTWSSPDFPISGAGVLDATGATAGTYTLFYTLSGTVEPNCPPIDSTVMMLLVPSTAGMGRDTSVCDDVDAVINLFDLLTGNDPGGSWAAEPGLDGMAGTFSTAGLSAGMYELIYSFQAVGECPASSSSIIVTIDDLPMADAGADAELNCDNPTSTIGGTGTSSGGNFSYLWEETGSGLSVPNATSVTTEVGVAGTYLLTVTNDDTGCTITDEVVITKSDDQPSMTVVPTNITCFGANDGFVSVTDPTGGDGNYTYSFNGGAPVALDELQLTNLSAGDYTIRITDGVGCFSEYPFNIAEPGELTVDIVGSPVIVGELGTTFTLTVEPFDTTGVTSIVWTEVGPGGPVVATGVTSVQVTPTENTTYYVEVMNGNDCVANDLVQLQLEQNIDITFPNIINPGGTENPVFYIIDNDVRLIEKMVIFDRWGEKVFGIENVEPNDPSVGWDARFKNVYVESGVYVFYVEVEFIEGTRESFAGDITVNR